MSNPLQEIMCCLGPSLAGNPTQYVMEKCFQHSGWDRRFLSLQVGLEDLPAAVAGMRAMDFRGAVVTGLLQSAIIECLDNLGPDAQRAQVVNCLYRDRDRNWFGENTIGVGFLRSLPATFDLQGQKVLIFGAGATAQAIALALAKESVAEVVVSCQEEDSGTALVAILEGEAEIAARFVRGEGPLKAEQDVNLIVRASEANEIESSESVPVVEESLRPEMLLVDTCLGSPTTGFLRTGANRGCATLQGQQVQVNVWAECIRLWTGSDPDTDVMREALEEYLGL